jgi:hypothetical protein
MLLPLIWWPRALAVVEISALSFALNWAKCGRSQSTNYVVGPGHHVTLPHAH